MDTLTSYEVEEFCIQSTIKNMHVIHIVLSIQTCNVERWIAYNCVIPDMIVPALLLLQFIAGATLWSTRVLTREAYKSRDLWKALRRSQRVWSAIGIELALLRHGVRGEAVGNGSFSGDLVPEVASAARAKWNGMLKRGVDEEGLEEGEEDDELEVKVSVKRLEDSEEKQNRLSELGTRLVGENEESITAVKTAVSDLVRRRLLTVPESNRDPDGSQALLNLVRDFSMMNHR
jgi:hypothetical protein